jgi:hypothetical protein
MDDAMKYKQNKDTYQTKVEFNVNNIKRYKEILSLECLANVLAERDDALGRSLPRLTDV